MKSQLAAYLQWGAILVQLQGDGQGADDDIPPELVLAALTTHSHVHTHTISHSS